MSIIKGKIVLITGGTGSIGRELLRQVLIEHPAQVRVFSRDESKQHELMEEFNHPKNLRLLIGDVRDKERLNFAFQDVDIIFHAAALKHVPSCEYNPFEAVRTNILGSQNVIDDAIANHVGRVVAISTDKVVDPIGVMGTSKLMMEKLIINANYYKGNAPTKFSCVRFGNVAWARGSVLPLWKNQAEKNGVITVTNGDMTRFMMSIKDAAKLVIEASNLMQGGETFILKMPAITLTDLAKEFLDKYYPRKKISIKLIGNRIGDKLHEGLIGPGDGEVLENARMLISTPDIWTYTHSPAEERKRKYTGFKKRKDTDSYMSNQYIDVSAVRKII
ncbi:MAG: SDR family NAD(P)-dependent oxidoreductase [bacterium]|nr:SDR family NAD(P)-dependent oxidoreductase [bacterium]